MSLIEQTQTGRFQRNVQKVTPAQNAPSRVETYLYQQVYQGVNIRLAKPVDLVSSESPRDKQNPKTKTYESYITRLKQKNLQSYLKIPADSGQEGQLITYQLRPSPFKKQGKNFNITMSVPETVLTTSDVDVMHSGAQVDLPRISGLSEQSHLDNGSIEILTRRYSPRQLDKKGAPSGKSDSSRNLGSLKRHLINVASRSTNNIITQSRNNLDENNQKSTLLIPVNSIR